MRGGNHNPTGKNQFSNLGSQPWIKVRFSVKEIKPVEKAPGPYRAFRMAGGPPKKDLVIYAFVRKLSQVENLWPDAHEIEHMGAFAELPVPAFE
jgi:hypothetical protein